MMTSHTSPVDIEQAMPLAEMSIAQIAALPPAQLQEAHTNLLTLQSLVKGVLDRGSSRPLHRGCHPNEKLRRIRRWLPPQAQSMY